MSISKKASFESFKTEVLRYPKLELQRLVFEVPLYEKMAFYDEADFQSIFRDKFFRLDGHCVGCKRDSVFHNAGYDIKSVPSFATLLGFRSAEFICQRNPFHKLFIVFQSKGMKLYDEDTGEYETVGWIQKVGQQPSHADIANGVLGAYSKVLDGQDRSEFIRANGLAAHGVNIGAFVYLRRVFERLLDRAQVRAADRISVEDFQQARVIEKIELLGDDVPPFMRENKKIYGVLSKGIHELEEQECGVHYTILMQSCLLMLEQEKDLEEKRKIEADLKAAIGRIEN